MKKICDLTESCVTPSKVLRKNTFDDERFVLPSKKVDELFDRLEAHYNLKWSSQFKDDEEKKITAKKTWGYTLMGLNNDDLGYGLKIVGDHYPKWPPTPTEFRKLCRMNFKNIDLYEPEEVIKAKKRIASESLAEIRGYL